MSEVPLKFYIPSYVVEIPKTKKSERKLKQHLSALFLRWLVKSFLEISIIDSKKAYDKIQYLSRYKLLVVKE